MSEIIQLYTQPVGLPIQQAQAQDAGSQEFPCPNCECSIGASERCPYCHYDLISWALSLQQSSAISETMQEMRLKC